MITSLERLPELLPLFDLLVELRETRDLVDWLAADNPPLVGLTDELDRATIALTLLLDRVTEDGDESD